MYDLTKLPQKRKRSEETLIPSDKIQISTAKQIKEELKKPLEFDQYNEKFGIP